VGLLIVDGEVETVLEPQETEPLESIRKRVYKSAEAEEKERKVPPTRILADISRHKRIMELFLKYPRRKFTIREISGLAGGPYATTWRFIQKLDRAGLILTEKIGNSLSCTLNTQATFLKEVEKVLEIEVSPQRGAAREFTEKVKGVKGVLSVVLFGSVARGEEKLTSDIDVAVFVDKKRKKIEEKITGVAEEILEKSKMSIVPIILTRDEIQASEQFAREIERGVVLYERV
jgi:predicted nucleotidyltransferase